MKFSILQQDLLPALSSVARSTTKSTLPVLSHILLETEDGKLKLSATNLEIGVVKRINAQINDEGSITIPAKTLVDVVSSLGGENIEFESSQELLKISTNNFNASINGIASTEFPTIPLSGEQSALIDAGLLSETLPQITFAAASDEGRPVLTGILTEVKKDSLELVATDGFRLAHKRSKIELNSGKTFKSLIPRRTFEEVARIIHEDFGSEKSTEKVEISTSENQNQMIFKVGQTQISSRLIEGNFPNWEKIIPTEFENRTVIDRLDLLKGVKLASVFAKDNSSVVKIQTKEGGLIITSQAKELGSQETEISAQTEGGEIIIAFNAKFLIDALSANSSTQVAIEFSGNLSPALIKPIGQEGLEYVVMPIRLS